MTDADSDELDYLEVYSRKCLRCSHLVEGAKQAYEECHRLQGNEDCPAPEVRIVVTGKAARAARLIMKAREDRDPAREAKILQSMADESPAVLHQLYARLS
ncbi:hypothetical protein D3C87_1251980 [compost metagenome]